MRYFEEVTRHQLTPRQLHGNLAFFEASVRRLLAGHASGRSSTGRAFAAYLPRFHGLRADDVFSQPVTEADARLVVARLNGAPGSIPRERLVDQARDRRTAERGGIFQGDSSASGCRIPAAACRDPAILSRG